MDGIVDKYYDPENIPLYRNGVIYIEKRDSKVPAFIVELVRLHGSTWAFVYDVDTKFARKGIAKKRGSIEKRSTQKVQSDSTLANYVNSLFGSSEIEVFQENPYIYQSLVIGGKSSFTGKEGDGFYERVKDKPTNLFIGINDITWNNEMEYRSEDLVKELLRSNEEELMDSIDGESY